MSTELPNAVFTAQVTTSYRRFSDEEKSFLKQITSDIKVITEDPIMNSILIYFIYLKTKKEIDANFNRMRSELINKFGKERAFQIHMLFQMELEYVSNERAVGKKNPNNGTAASKTNVAWCGHVPT